MTFLPIRIMKMVKELHTRGYTSLYLYSGMSPSGTDWRYYIGNMRDGKWPVRPYIVTGSLRKEGDTAWASDNATVAQLADGFELYYQEHLAGTRSSPTVYSRWFAKLIDRMGDDELLVFFADYDAPHEHLLKDAPGFERFAI